MDKLNRNIDSILSLPAIDRVICLADTDIEPKLLRAMVCALSKTEKQMLEDTPHPPVIDRILGSLNWEEWQNQQPHDIESQPQYRPVDELLKDFLNPKSKKKQAARKELQKRLPYLAATEQRRTIYAFLDTEVKTDRVFVFKYLDEHYDPSYDKAIKTVWQLYHDFEAAKLLTHYASSEFIEEHFEQLAHDYRYFPVRMRMPSNYPLDRSRLEMHELIHLCVRQHLPLTEQEAFAILSKTLHRQLIRDDAYIYGSLFNLTYIRGIIWALGHLGFQEIITRFIVENERTKPLFVSGDREKMNTTIRDQLCNDGFNFFHDILGTKEDLEIKDL